MKSTSIFLIVIPLLLVGCGDLNSDEGIVRTGGMYYNIASLNISCNIPNDLIDEISSLPWQMTNEVIVPYEFPCGRIDCPESTRLYKQQNGFFGHLSQYQGKPVDMYILSYKNDTYHCKTDIEHKFPGGIDIQYIDRCFGKGGTIKGGGVDENGSMLPRFCSTPNPEDTSILPPCEFNINYFTRDECGCEGTWTNQDNGSGITCVPGRRTHFCRKIIGNKVAGEVIISFIPNITLEEASKVAVNHGGIILEFSCNFDGRYSPRITVGVTEGKEDEYIIRIQNETVVQAAYHDEIMYIDD